jgi:hypothetical protein
LARFATTSSNLRLNIIAAAGIRGALSWLWLNQARVVTAVAMKRLAKAGDEAS